MKRIFLSVCAAQIFSASLVAPHAYATGIPVIDGANFAQNVISAIESVSQTLKQIEEYKTQLMQYEDQLRNAAAPPAYIWDQASRTMDQLVGAVNTLDHWRSRYGGIDGYLEKFQDVNYYRTSPCFTSSGCSAAQWEALDEQQRVSFESRKRANDALFRGLEQQQGSISSDARRLEELQQTAQSAEGRMAALQAANMLASAQAHQLLQIRGIMLAEQQAAATQMAAQADKEAKEQALAEKLRSGRFVPATNPIDLSKTRIGVN